MKRTVTYDTLLSIHVQKYFHLKKGEEIEVSSILL